VLTARGLLGVVLAAAFLAIGLWYALGTFTVTRDVSGQPSAIGVGEQPLEIRTMTIECRADGSAVYLTASGEVMFFDSATWSPQSPTPLCDDARPGRYPLAIGLAVLGTVIGVVVAASGSRTSADD